ncbi:MAG: 3-phosphoshikimate 1-carboxyvinyltransferase [Canidatus Methanoxibalbensis ujae]|nr:3-phosphoshikimate 1-carboxyvinyltransferase [Candidatus Methanoxibalbensis ujae]
MRAVLYPSKLIGDVDAPPSKSYTHRALAVSLLSSGKCDVMFPLISDDTKATMDAINALGASVFVDGERRCVSVEGVGSSPKTPEDVINARNSGTTLRFFTAICALCDCAAVLTGDESLRRRTNTPLLNALNDLGADAFSTTGNGRAPIVVRGILRGGETEIDCSISSQFISALLIACPLASGDSCIKVRNLISKPYMHMTMDVMRRAGVDIEMHESVFHIKGGREYSLKHFKVPGDFSSASYILAAAALTSTSSVRVHNLYRSMQGDSRIVDILRDMGADVRWNEEGGIVEVRGGSELKGITVDLRDSPDLAPTVAVLGAFAGGKTEIKGASHLRHKETDRIRTISEELRKFGIKVEERADGFVIHGNIAALKGGRRRVVVRSHGDHRVAMAACVAALAADVETVVEGVECVSVSYPDFFKHLAALGANFLLNSHEDGVSKEESSKKGVESSNKGVESSGNGGK